MMKDICLKKLNLIFIFFTAILTLFPFLSVALKPVINEIFPPEITGECILEIKGSGFGKDKGIVLLSGDKMKVFKWKRKKIRVFVPEAYELPNITIATERGKTLVFQTEEKEKKCNYSGLESVMLGSGEISYPEKWKRIKYNKKKGVAVLLRKDRNALISFARTKVIPDIFTLYFMVNNFKKNEISLGKMSVSSVNSFTNCEGRLGYSFMVKSFLKKNKSFFQYYIYFMDDSRRIYQVIFSSMKKKDCRKKYSRNVLRNIHFTE